MEATLSSALAQAGSVHLEEMLENQGRKRNLSTHTVSLWFSAVEKSANHCNELLVAECSTTLILMEKCLEAMGKTIRAQTVDGVLKSTQLLSSKPIPGLSSSAEKWITQHRTKIAHTKLFPLLHLRACALLTNQAESEKKDAASPGKPAGADSSRQAGRQREASLFPSHFLLWEQPKAPSHEIRRGGHTGNGSSCPAALIINASRPQQGAEAERGQAAAWEKQGKIRAFP